MSTKQSNAPPPEAAAPPRIAYGAKSTPDPRASIPRQLADCRAAAGPFVAEYHDEDASAFKGNRGGDLARAKDHALRLAAEHGRAELWVQHSDRLARGDGITADHLAEVWFALRRHGVRIRSVQDDHNLDDAIRVVLVGERNFEDSKRKAQAVAGGVRGAAELGRWPGGIQVDGYRVLREVDSRGKVHPKAVKDPDRQEIYELMWRLALEGWEDRAIALDFARRGYRTQPYRNPEGRGGRPYKRPAKAIPFDADRIGKALTRPVYAGIRVHKGNRYEGDWPGYVTPEQFERVQQMRRERQSGGAIRQPPGRPPEGYVLHLLAVCGECGGPMHCITDAHVRQDGTRKRTYVCNHHRKHPPGSPHHCPVGPVDAALVDAAVVANLEEFLGDLEGWRERLAQGRAAERDRMAQEVERATADLAQAERSVASIGEQWAAHTEAGDQAAADAVLEVLKRKRAERSRAERRQQAASDALTAASMESAAEPTLGAVAEFSERIRRELLGRMRGAAGDVKRLNATLREYFARVELSPGPDGVTINPQMSSRSREWVIEKLEASGLMPDLPGLITATNLQPAWRTSCGSGLPGGAGCRRVW